jgi:hypothetical protein
MLDYDFMDLLGLLGSHFPTLVYPDVMHIPLRLVWEYAKRARYMEQLDMYKLNLQLMSG